MSSRFAAMTAAALIVGGLSGSSAKADWYVDLLGNTGSNGPPLTGTAYIQFSNQAGSYTRGGFTYTNRVVVTIVNLIENPGANFTDVAFNIKHAFFAAAHQFSEFLTGGGNVTPNYFGVNEDAEGVPPEQGFDVHITYPPGNGSGTFQYGEQSQFAFYSDTSGWGVGTDYSFFDQVNPGADPSYFGYCHVQTNNFSSKSGDTDGGSYTPPGRHDPDPVPVPASIIGLLTAGAGLFAFRRMVSIA